jgi:hypothetical protein
VAEFGPRQQRVYTDKFAIEVPSKKPAAPVA